MQRTTLILVLFLSMFFHKNASAQETISRIEKLNLGSLSGLIAGKLPFSGSGLWGRLNKRFYFPFFSFAENPAFLTGYQSTTLHLSYVPEFSLNLNGLLNLDGNVHSAVDEITGDYGAPDLIPVYPNLSFRFRLEAALPEGVLIVPSGAMIFGFSYFRPIHIQSRLHMTEIESSISTQVEVGGGLNEVLLNNYLDGVSNFELSMSSAAFWMAKPLLKKGGVGLRIERRTYYFDLLGNWNIQGAMIYNGREYLFGDPEALWPNEIGQRVDANYQGTEWCVQIGGWFALKPTLLLNAALQFTRDVSLSGKTRWDVHKLPALNLQAVREGGGVEEILDPAQLDLSRLTLTESVQKDSLPVMRIATPEQLKLGIFWRRGNWAFYLSQQLRFNSFYLEYGNDRFVFDWRSITRLTILRNHMYTTFGVGNLKIYGDQRRDFLQQTVESIVPMFSFGYGRSVTPSLNLVAGVDVVPLPAIQLAFQYSFPE